MKKIILLLIFSLFLSKCIIFIDSDFGWHLRTGQIALSTGVPKTDPFTYSMPSFPYVDTSWLTDVFFAKTYPIVGLFGLAIIVSFVVLTSLVLNGASLPLLFLSTAAILPFVTVRPLIFSWLVFSIFLYIGSDDIRWKKWRIYLPILFWIGVNLHGGFISYLALLAILLIVKFLRKSLSSVDFFILILCICSTFINPYGIYLWREVLDTVFSSALKNNILEWKPVTEWFNPAAAMLTAIAMVFLTKYWKKINLFLVLSFCFYFLSSILALRNIPFLVITSVSIILSGLNLFSKEKIDKKRFDKALVIFSIIMVLVSSIQLLILAPHVFNLREDTFYPKSAITFLKQNLPAGQIFSEYDWGGYLIWKLPEKKVFMDGRMPIWNWVPPNNNESSDAFLEYREILSGKKDFQPVFAKFNIKTVLWPKDNNKDFLAKLEKSGWKKIYEDKVAVIYMIE